MKTCFFILCYVLPFWIFADTAKFSTVVLSADDLKPIKGVQMQANFWDNNGWEAWTKAPHVDVDIQTTDGNGFCKFRGKTNCGNVCCFVSVPPNGFYAGGGWGTDFKKKNIFGVWQPDNLVVTIRLDRVEKPIPLFVKKVRLRNLKDGIGGFDGTNSVVKFDFMKGDWLPPYGKGEIADVEFRSTLKIKGRAWFMFEPRKYDWVYFYNFGTDVRCLNKYDGFAAANPSPYAGIKIRQVAEEPGMKSLALVNIGRNKKYHHNGEDWNCQNYKDDYSDRVVSFRIRSRLDDNGKLKEAYYGKIYGDFKIDGDEKKGLIGISFLYYLNPKPLDRNLEWDMKTNLCPNPGSLSQKQP